MKSEDRHKMQTNSLAIVLTNLIEGLRGKGNLILGVAIVGIVAAMLAMYLSNKKERNQATAWMEYYRAAQSGNRDSLGSVAEKFPDSIAGQWALHAEGVGHLKEGTRLAFTNKSSSRERFNKALTAFETLAQQTTDEMLKSRALFGAAQAKEALGRLEEAISAYREVSESYSDTVIGKLAAQQVDRLSNPDAKEWMTWFAKYEPAPNPLATPGLFDNLGDLPQDPNFSQPGPGELFSNPTPSSDSVILPGGPTDTPGTHPGAAGGIDLPVLDDPLSPAPVSIPPNSTDTSAPVPPEGNKEPVPDIEKPE